MRRGNPVAWNRARDVASRALSGTVFASVGNATHFHTTGVSPGWRNSLIRVNQVGSHLFYRFGGRSGSSAAFNYATRPSSNDDQPRLIQASMDPTESVRQAGQAVALHPGPGPGRPVADRRPRRDRAGCPSDTGSGCRGHAAGRRARRARPAQTGAAAANPATPRPAATVPTASAATIAPPAQPTA